MEQNIKRSETIVKKYRDDWVDEKGYLHTKITRETITGPMDNVQVSQPLNNVPLIPGIFNSIFRKRPMMQRPIQQPQVQPIKSQQPMVQQQKPQIDFRQLIITCKLALENMGIDPKEVMNDVLKEDFLRPIPGEAEKDLDTLENKVEPLEDKADALTDEREVNLKSKTNKQKPLKNLKKKQVKTNQKIKQKKIQNKSE